MAPESIEMSRFADGNGAARYSRSFDDHAQRFARAASPAIPPERRGQTGDWRSFTGGIAASAVPQRPAEV
jgi:hypothetical protein